MSGVKHLHTTLVNVARITSVAAITTVLLGGFTVSQLLSAAPSAVVEDAPPSRSGSALEVQGYGQQAPTNGGQTLQGAKPVEQSSPNSKTIQNSQSQLEALQPSSGDTNFEGGN